MARTSVLQKSVSGGSQCVADVTAEQLLVYGRGTVVCTESVQQEDAYS